MDIAIITSNRDPASVNIRENLVECYGFRNNRVLHSGHDLSIYEFEEELIFLDGIDKKIPADLFIFPSKHVSKAGIDSFSAHSPGNWGKAEHGGKSRELCFAPAALIKRSIQCLEKNHLGIRVFQEATHHGPFLGKPVMFVEIGSSEHMYTNPLMGKVVANAIMDSISGMGWEISSAIGIGGPHYCPNFRKIMLETGISVAHVCPKHMLEFFDEEMLLQAMERTVPKTDFAILDWKGLGSQKERIKRFITSRGIRFARVSEC